VGDDDNTERITEAYRNLRSRLKTDEQLDALDQLMEYLFSLDIEERKRVADELITYLKEEIENQRPIN
jgi:hypothetical protein